MTEEPYGDQWFHHMTANIRQILEQTQAVLPHTKIYLMSFYPANLHLPWQTPASIQWMKLRTPENLDRCNQTLEEIAQTYGCHFIKDVYKRQPIARTSGERIFITPVARKMATEKGYDLSLIHI